MKALQDKVNTQAPDSDFPFGDLTDDNGTGNGTPANRELFSDSMQFFEKLMSEAGITPNGLLDNDSNGWQLYDAFRKLTRPYKLNALRLAYGTSVVATDQFNDIGPIVWTRTSPGLFTGTLAGAFSPSKTNIQVQVNGLSGTGREIIARCTDANTIEIEAYDGGSLSDNPMIGAPYFMIMVFD